MTTGQHMSTARARFRAFFGSAYEATLDLDGTPLAPINTAGRRLDARDIGGFPLPLEIILAILALA
jgi:hypothetical protein